MSEKKGSDSAISYLNARSYAAILLVNEDLKFWSLSFDFILEFYHWVTSLHSNIRNAMKKRRHSTILLTLQPMCKGEGAVSFNADVGLRGVRVLFNVVRACVRACFIKC